MQLRARVFDSLEELAPYADRWNELVPLSPGNSIFLTWEWLSAWNTLVAQEPPYIIAVFDEEEHPAAFFLFIKAAFISSNIYYKCLRPMGDCQCGAEYPDIIAAPDSMADVLTCIQDCLEKNQIQMGLSVSSIYFRAN